MRKIIGFLPFILIVFYLFSCGGVHLSQFQPGKKTVIPVGDSPEAVRCVFTYPVEIDAPREIVLFGKDFLVADNLSGTIKKFNHEGRFVGSVAASPALDIGKFTVDKDGDCYVQNFLVAASNSDSTPFEILKFDPAGKQMKSLGTLYGMLVSMSVNDKGDLLLVVRNAVGGWLALRYMNDLFVGQDILPDSLESSATNQEAILTSVFPVEKGRYLLLEYELSLKKDGTYASTRYYLFDPVSGKTSKFVREKIFDRQTLIMVDDNRNMFYFKNTRKNLVEVDIQNIDYDPIIRKSMSLPFKTRDGFLLNVFIDSEGRVFQIRATKKSFTIIQYQ